MADSLIPSASGATHGLVQWGIPLAAGAAGFLFGDVFGSYEVFNGLIGPQPVELESGRGISWTAGTESGLPLSEFIDYTAFLALIPYAIAAVIVRFIGGRIGGSAIATIAIRSICWLLYGIMARLILRGFLPSRVPVQGQLSFVGP